MHDIAVYITSGGTRSPVTLLLQSLATWVCSLELGEGQARNRGQKWRALYPGRPHRVLLSFNPSFSLLLLNPEENRGWTRKRIQFWILLLFSCSFVSDSLRPHGLQHTRLPVLHHFPELAKTHVHWISGANHLILCHPLLLLSSIFPNVRVFSNESTICISWSKYWSFNFSISLSNEYSGLISL